MKEFKIEIPEGYEIDKEKSTFEKLIFKSIKEKLPKSWDNLEVIKGFYVDNNSEVDSVNCLDFPDVERDLFKNVFPTKEEAEASIALAQLCQLRNRWNEGWTPEWTNSFQYKYVIVNFLGELQVDSVRKCSRILAFKTKELAEEFLSTFKNLIETAKLLL